jgi:SAM-dependent methyltransferase
VTPAEDFYRPLHQELPALERRALALCSGRVLDLGAGAGRHALDLQERGLEVTALDVSPEAVEVMRLRGVRDARCGGLEAVTGQRFDTILLLMHGIGLVGSLQGLDRFLEAGSALLDGGGQVLCDSADLAAVMPALAEHRGLPPGSVGRYYGEVEFRLSYGEVQGEPYPWLFVDAERLQRHAEAAAFDFEIGAWGARGAYLARLSKR